MSSIVKTLIIHLRNQRADYFLMLEQDYTVLIFKLLSYQSKEEKQFQTSLVSYKLL